MKSVVDRILSASVTLFAERGYAATSVQEIVAAAGVTKGAMYHYFQSKDDLLFAIYDRMLSLQSDRLDQIRAAGGPTVEVLRRVCEDVVVTSIDLLPEGTVFTRSRHMLSPDRQREITKRRRDYHDRFSELVATGQAEGIFRTDIPRSILVAHFFSDLHYLPIWYSPTGARTRAEVATQLTDLYLRSITVPAST